MYYRTTVLASILTSLFSVSSSGAVVTLDFQGISTTVENNSEPLGGPAFNGTLEYDTGGTVTLASGDQISGYYFNDTVSALTIGGSRTVHPQNQPQSTIFFNRSSSSDRFLTQINFGNFTFTLVVDFDPTAFGPTVPIGLDALNTLSASDIISTEVSYNTSGTSGFVNRGELTSWNGQEVGVEQIPEPDVSILGMLGLGVLLVRRRNG